MILLIPSYQFIKLFLDNKMSNFEEYGAFNIFFKRSLGRKKKKVELQSLVIFYAQHAILQFVEGDNSLQSSIIENPFI